MRITLRTLRFVSGRTRALEPVAFGSVALTLYLAWSFFFCPSVRASGFSLLPAVYFAWCHDESHDGPATQRDLSAAGCHAASSHAWPVSFARSPLPVSLFSVALPTAPVVADCVRLRRFFALLDADVRFVPRGCFSAPCRFVASAVVVGTYALVGCYTVPACGLPFFRVSPRAQWLCCLPPKRSRTSAHMVRIGRAFVKMCATLRDQSLHTCPGFGS